MAKRSPSYGLVNLVSLGLILLFFNNQIHCNLLEYEIQPTSASNESRGGSPNISDIQESNISNNLSSAIQQVINLQREIIRNDMMGYEYPNGKYNISANKLDDLLIEKNGKPIRSIILSTWRSGSSFLDGFLAEHPGNFDYFEPLVDFGTIQIRGSSLAREALKNIRALLNCDYSNLGRYLAYRNNGTWPRLEDESLRKQCQHHTNICNDPGYRSGMCKLFPFQSMKVLRLRLSFAQDLLADKDLAVRLVLLIRDPRGILQSRKHRSFCRSSPDCSDPSLLCADMVSDYNAALELQKNYPTSFRVVRYENFAADPYEYAKRLLTFYGRDFHSKIRSFLDTHTVSDLGDPYSTYRNSTASAFHWKNDLKYEELAEIQRVCSEAMEHWGYVPAMNETHQRYLNPLTNCSDINFL